MLLRNLNIEEERQLTMQFTPNEEANDLNFLYPPQINNNFPLLGTLSGPSTLRLHD